MGDESLLSFAFFGRRNQELGIVGMGVTYRDKNSRQLFIRILGNIRELIYIVSTCSSNSSR
jgi:hypothetical protein